MAVSKERMIEIAAGIESPVLIDDHTGETTTIAAIAVVSIGGERHHIVPLFRDTVFCLNSVSKDKDGIWHLNRTSVSGNMDARERSIEEAIAVFNDGYLRHGGDFSGEMHEVTLVKEF